MPVKRHDQALDGKRPARSVACLWITQKELDVSSSSQHRIGRLLTRKEAAIFLTGLGLIISAQTLARLFSENKGPLCMRVGRRAMYREADLVAYLRRQCSAPRQSSAEPLRPASPEDLALPANDRSAPHI
jgi:hypothetical protein